MNDSALIRRSIDRRRAVLQHRVDFIEYMLETGEGSSAGVELTSIVDEMQFLRDVYAMLYLSAWARKLART